MKTALVLFAKPPIEGRVKTRLARTVGDLTAYRLYCLFLKWHIETINEIHKVKNRKIRFSTFIYTVTSSDLSLPAAQKLFNKIKKTQKTRFVSQAPGSLGDKMEDAFEKCLKSHDFCIIWGADIPLIHRNHFNLALNHNPHACIIPATDGGYSLVSISRQYFIRGIMKNVPWSSEHTLKFQLKQLEKLQIPVDLLEPVPDLDTGRDIAANILYMNTNPNSIYKKRAEELAKLLENIYSESEE